MDKETVKEFVEKKYPPVLRDELYAFLPEKLYALRASIFISLANFKWLFTMCTKNTFGLIPAWVGNGSRMARCHGRANRNLSRNIVDINKIYRSIFNVVGVVEGVNSLTNNMGEGKYTAVFGYR